MFLNKLMYFKINPSKQTGFIVEIDKILQKYQLSHILSSYLQDGVFPGKIAWKRMIKANVHETTKTAWHYRLSNPEFYRFKMLHCKFSPHWSWLFSQDNRRLLKLCISVIQLISCVSSLPHISSTCSNCQGEFTNLVDHCIHECIYLKRQSERFWREIFSLGPDIFMYLHMHL